MRAIAGQRAGRGVEGAERATDAGIEFKGVETGIDRDGRPRVLEAVAELHAFGSERAEIAKSRILSDAAQADAAAFAADKPAVRKIVAQIGRATAGIAVVKARKVAV